MSKSNKEYTNGEITVVWKPDICIHAGNCVRGLSKVFKPKESPWIQLENATTEEIKNQVKQCPSGALSYYMNEIGKPEKTETTEIEVTPGGPLIIRGKLSVKNADGTFSNKENATAFCRCGASANKPYCDGSHRKITFEG
jgi:uncharacterized Fe-S cluster protein YjdI